MKLTNLKSIDSDPEFFHGLTFWGEKVSAQVTEMSTLDERRHGLVINDMHNVNADSVVLSPTDACRLRDLLNLATARGFI